MWSWRNQRCQEPFSWRNQRCQEPFSGIKGVRNRGNQRCQESKVSGTVLAIIAACVVWACPILVPDTFVSPTFHLCFPHLCFPHLCFPHLCFPPQRGNHPFVLPLDLVVCSVDGSDFDGLAPDTIRSSRADRTCDFGEIADNRGENRELLWLPPHLTFRRASRSGRFGRTVTSLAIRKFDTTSQVSVAFWQRPILTGCRGFRLTGRNSLR